jgi:hypothetical protein
MKTARGQTFCSNKKGRVRTDYHSKNLKNKQSHRRTLRLPKIKITFPEEIKIKVTPNLIAELILAVFAILGSVWTGLAYNNDLKNNETRLKPFSSSLVSGQSFADYSIFSNRPTSLNVCISPDGFLVWKTEFAYILHITNYGEETSILENLEAENYKQDSSKELYSTINILNFEDRKNYDTWLSDNLLSPGSSPTWEYQSLDTAIDKSQTLVLKLGEEIHVKILNNDREQANNMLYSINPDNPIWKNKITLQFSNDQIIYKDINLARPNGDPLSIYPEYIKMCR